MFRQSLSRLFTAVFRNVKRNVQSMWRTFWFNNKPFKKIPSKLPIPCITYFSCYVSSLFQSFEFYEWWHIQLVDNCARVTPASPWARLYTTQRIQWKSQLTNASRGCTVSSQMWIKGRGKIVEICTRNRLQTHLKSILFGKNEHTRINVRADLFSFPMN